MEEGYCVKKVDIITLHRLYNYGSVLQAYATQKVFEKHGCDTSIIDYVSPERTIAKIFLNKGANPDNKGFCLLFYRIMKIGSIALKQLTFGSFVKKQLNLTRKYIKPEDLEKAPPKADIYVTGSDQTWNSQYNKGIDRGYYLDFLPDEARRVAFVASFGQTSINDQEKPMVIHYLKRYIESLLRVTELQDRLIKSKEELSVYKDEIDYSKVNSKLAVERQKADAFISNVLLKV